MLCARPIAAVFKARGHGMDKRVIAAFAGAAFYVLALGGCSTTDPLFGSSGSTAAASDTTGSVTSPAVASADKPAAPSAKSAHAAPPDDLQLGKKYFAAKNYDLAAQSFRAATEKRPADAAGWIGLATSYDRLHRFDLADEAYRKAIGIAGETAEILNDQGYSYMLRGDYARAKAKLEAAEAKDPANPYVQDNMRVLAERYFAGKAVQ
jgi:Flp pilus assembly protein TadD